MSNHPEFVSLTPIAVDSRRITLRLRTTNFPEVSNIKLDLNPDSSRLNSPDSLKPDPAQAYLETPYPNVELSLLDQQNNPVAEVIVIEHQEETLELTLHLRNSQPDQPYIAQAVMSRGPEVLQTIQTPFTLKSAHSDLEA